MKQTSDPGPQSIVTYSTSRRDFFRLAGATAGFGAAALLLTPLTGEAQPHRRISTRVPVDFTDQRTRMQHLLRRTGFAATEEELAEGLDLGEARVIERVLGDSQREAWPEAPPFRDYVDGGPDPADALVEWWTRRLLHTREPGREKLTLFWHGWHVSGFPKVDDARAMYQQLRFQREHATSAFADILIGISRQPAMLLYLDNDPNVKGSPNENWARELMELFSMGRGAFTERDVREAARAFTGYSYDRENGRFTFETDEYDSGPKEILGETGAFDGDDVVRLIVRQEATPWFVARRVWTRYAYPAPEDEVLEPLVTAFVKSGGEMRAVFRAAWSHPEFYSARAYRALVKSPVELAAGAARQLGVIPRPRIAYYWAEEMGQAICWPPNVGGWPGGKSWLGSGRFLARLNGLDALLFDRLETTFDPDRYLRRHRLDTPREFVDYAVALFLDGLVPPEAREALTAFAAGGRDPATPFDRLPDDERDLRVRGTLYLALASAPYQLA